MILSDILDPQAVISSIRCSSKKRLIQELSINIASVYGVDLMSIFSALQEREILGSTGMGHGVAIPHARIESIGSLRGLFARLVNPIDFSSMDRRAVDLVFVLKYIKF